MLSLNWIAAGGVPYPIIARRSDHAVEKSNFYPSIIHALPVNRPDSRGAKMKACP
jgi:hypothetical protein